LFCQSDSSFDQEKNIKNFEADGRTDIADGQTRVQEKRFASGAPIHPGNITAERATFSLARGFVRVADTFWSVHIKFCFHQKKIKSKRPTTRIRPAERQHKGRDQSSTKNVTSKTQRLHSVAKQHKVSDR